MSTKHPERKSEAIIGILGMLLVAVIVAVCVLMVVDPINPADEEYPLESNLMAIENQRDYGLYGLPGQRLGVYIDQYTAGPAPACIRK